MLWASQPIGRLLGEKEGNDRGTVMLLTMGLVPIVAALIAVGTDAAVLFTQKRAVSTEIEAAVLAAAQSADLEALYTGRQVKSLPLDCRQAREVVRRKMSAIAPRAGGSAVTVTSIDCNPTTVAASARVRVQLPFAQHFGINPEVQVGSRAAATAPMQ